LSEAMQRGNPLSVLLTSDTDGWQTDTQQQILKTLFQPSIQLYIVIAEADKEKSAPVPPNRWEKLLQNKDLTAKQRAAYEQIAKLHSIKIGQGDWGTIPIPSFFGNPKIPTDVLYAMGVDALPMLAEALDDET